MKQLSKKIVGDESSAKLIEECALELFLFFLEKDSTLISAKDVNEMKRNYGAIDLPLAKEIAKVSENIERKHVSLDL